MQMRGGVGANGALPFALFFDCCSAILFLMFVCEEGGVVVLFLVVEGGCVGCLC